MTSHSYLLCTIHYQIQCRALVLTVEANVMQSRSGSVDLLQHQYTTDCFTPEIVIEKF